MKTLPGVRRILFVRTDRIGDTLMNLGAIRLLRQTYPKAWITLLCDRGVAPLFEGQPDLDEVMSVDAAVLKKDWGSRLRLFRLIRKAGFDLALVSNPDRFFHALLFFARIPNRAGYSRKAPFFLNHTLKDDKDLSLRHEVDSNLRLVSLVSDAAWDGQMLLPVDTAARERVKDYLSRRGADEMVIAFHVGTTNLAKRWPVEHFSALADRIQQGNDAKVVLIGGPEEKEAGELMFRQTQISVVDAIGQFSLKELAAFLSLDNVKALISSDSGPAHIAWILGKPTVVLFAKDVPGSNPVRWGPRDGLSETIEKPMKDISVDEVLAALERALSK